MLKEEKEEEEEEEDAEVGEKGKKEEKEGSPQRQPGCATGPRRKGESE